MSRTKGSLNFVPHRRTLVGSGRIIEHGDRPDSARLESSPEGHISIYKGDQLITVWTLAEQSACWGPDLVINWQPMKQKQRERCTCCDGGGWVNDL